MNHININELEMNEPTISPFAVRPGEQLAVEDVPSPCSMSITPIDETILVAINKYLVLTSRMILKVLQNAGMQNITQRDLQHRLRLLTGSAFVTSACFTNADGSCAAAKVYSLGYRGRGYLKAQGVKPRLGGFVESLLSEKNAVAIKGYLAANQYMLNTSQNFHATMVGQIVLAGPGEEKVDKIFRAFGMVQQSDGRTLLIEPIRRGEIWSDYLPERLSRINATLRDQLCNYDFGKIQMILVAESNQHLLELNELLCTKRYCFEILLTSDTMVHKNPDHCLVNRQKIPGFLRFLFQSSYC